MKLLTADIEARLLANGRQNAERIAIDGNTIVAVDTPAAIATSSRRGVRVASMMYPSRSRISMKSMLQALAQQFTSARHAQ